MVIFLITGGCSLDPIGELFDSTQGPPYTEQIGSFLRITFNAGPDWYPCWSGDGSQIAYSAGGFEEITQGQVTVNVIPATGGVSRRVSPVWSRIDNNFYPCWIDGDNAFIYIAFRGLNFGAPLPPSITVVNSADVQEFNESVNVMSLTSPFDLGISPDGRAIAYSDSLPYTVHTRDTTVTMVKDDSMEPHGATSRYATAIWYAEFPLTGAVYRIGGTYGARGLSWAPDSETIAFSRDGEILTIPRQGGVAERLFEGNSPAWSPDSEKLAFSWNRNGNFDIYVVALGDIISERK